MATDETDISKEISRINAAKDKIKSNFVTLGISAEDSDLTQMAADSDNLPDFFSQLVDNVHPLDRITTGTYASIDNYTTAGLYWLVNTTVTDTPNTGSGLLIVTTSTKGKIIYQTFISYNTGRGYFATRCYTNSQWYGWDERPATTPISAGGTGATTASGARSNLSAAAADYEKWSIFNAATKRYDTQVSTDLLSISTNGGSVATSVHQPATIMTEDASTLKNSPVISGGFWAKRMVYPVVNPTGSAHITVELQEYEPIPGRRWLRTYYQGSGWSSKWIEINPELGVASEGTSGAWHYRIWKNGMKECWLSTSITHEVKQQSGSLYYSSTVAYPYPVSFTANPTLYIGVQSPNNRPFWGIPSSPKTGANYKKNAYIELMTCVSTDSINTNIYAYACGM